MRKVTILGLVALLLCVFTYFALFYVTPAERAELSTVEQSIEEKETIEVEKSIEPRSGVGTLESVLQWGENVECAISYDDGDQNTPVEGTYFVSEGSIRGDFLTDSPDLSGQIVSSMIVDDSIMYVWSEIDGEKYGMKISLSETEGSELYSNAVVPLNEDVRYMCKIWKNVDRSIFVPPGDVLFQDMNELMKAGAEEGVIYEEGEMSF